MICTRSSFFVSYKMFCSSWTNSCDALFWIIFPRRSNLCSPCTMFCSTKTNVFLEFGSFIPCVQNFGPQVWVFVPSGRAWHFLRFDGRWLRCVFKVTTNVTSWSAMQMQESKTNNVASSMWHRSWCYGEPSNYWWIFVEDPCLTC